MRTHGEGEKERGLLHPAWFGSGNLTVWCGNEGTTDTEEMADTHKRAWIRWGVYYLFRWRVHTTQCRNPAHLSCVYKEEESVSLRGRSLEGNSLGL